MVIKLKSNCVLEAIKAKIKNRKIKIIYLPAKINVVKCPHIMWTDGINDYDFGTNKKISSLQYFWYNGAIRIFPQGYAQKYKRVMTQRYIRAKKNSA